MTRRDLLRSLLWGGTGVAVPSILAGCGRIPSDRDEEAEALAQGAGLAVAQVTRSHAGEEHLSEAVAAVQGLTADLYRRLATEPGNLICSPYSVAVALAMTRNGARAQTASEMDQVLNCADLADYNAGMNALTRTVESRAGAQERADGSKATVVLDVANSLWGQRDTRWEAEFLAALARYYGAGMHLVDYKSNAEAARTLINAWTADKTHDRIRDLIPEGALDALVRLVLVNAIYLKAPWEEPFESSLTRPGPFRRSDGSVVRVPMMSGALELAGFGSGSGWQAARLPYAGRDLAMTVVVPETADLQQFSQSVDGTGLQQILSSLQRVPRLNLQLPRFEVRVNTQLNEHLKALGMPTAFDRNRADFSGMTTQEQLFVSNVFHDAYIAVDEKGTEAAAATAVVLHAVSAPPSITLTVHRPFLFVVHDIQTATPLFIGHVTDPAAAG